MNSFEHGNEILGSIKRGKYFEHLGVLLSSKITLFHGSSYDVEERAD
jgi:hypothetical protein